MSRSTAPRALLMFLFALVPLDALAGNYIVYLHGRGDATWRHALASAAGWTNVTLSYDGGARLADSTVGGQIESAFRTYCGAGNACLLACHSAGCMRVLKAVDHLSALKVSLNILWSEAAASAAGGTRLAEISTDLFGSQPIDEDIRRDSARSTTGWGYIQGAMSRVGSTMYHLAGRKDSCKFLVCGNWFLPSGACDGLVCMDSAGGGASSSSSSNGCTMALYPGRSYDSFYSPCAGSDLNHAALGDRVSQVIQSDVGN